MQAQYSAPFVGRQAELLHFEDLLEAGQGALWLVQGGPGLGKSRLLAECRGRLTFRQHPHVFHDLRQQAPTQGEALLRALCAGAQAAPRLGALAQGDLLTVVSELERHETGLRPYLEHVAKFLDSGEEGQASLFLRAAQAVLGVIFRSGQNRLAELRRDLANQPERILLEQLQQEGERHMVLFIDTYEHALADTARVETHLDLNSQYASHALHPEAKAAADFLRALIGLLTRRGWIVVVAGRQLGALAEAPPTPLARLDEREVETWLTPLLEGIPCPAEIRRQLAHRVWETGLRGNPLWVSAVTYWLGQRLQAGDSPASLVLAPNLAPLGQTPLEPPAASRHDARCKAEILQLAVAGWNLPMGQLWRIALPLRLDLPRLEALFDQEAARTLLDQIWQAGLCTGGGASGQRWWLHEEVRDVLLWWAEENGKLATPEARQDHRWLLEAVKNEKPGWVEVSWSLGLDTKERSAEAHRRGLDAAEPAQWFHEATWHALQGSENLVRHGHVADDYGLQVLGSPSLSPLEKWLVGVKLEELSSWQLSELVKTFDKEFRQWVELFGADNAHALRLAVRRGEASGVGDATWWLQRFELGGDPGSLIALLAQSNAETLRAMNIGAEDIQRWCERMLAGFGDDPSPGVREQVAKALFNKAYRLGQLQRPEEEIAAYDELLARSGADSSPGVREQVAKALFNKAYRLGQLQRPEEAIAAYDEILARFGADSSPGMREQVAKALFNKGVTLGRLQRPEEEIAAYDDLLARYGADPSPGMREQVAKALFNKGVTLGQLQRPEEEIAAYDELLARSGADSSPGVREQVAKALFNKAYRLGQLQRPEEAIAAYDELLARSGADSSPGMRERVAMAHNGKGFRLLLRAKRGWGLPGSARSDLQAAAACFAAARPLAAAADVAMVLGNQAYAVFLLGDAVQARALLGEPLALGGEALHQATLDDLATHPIPLDAAMRALLEEVWAAVGKP